MPEVKIIVVDGEGGFLPQNGELGDRRKFPKERCNMRMNRAEANYHDAKSNYAKVRAEYAKRPEEAEAQRAAELAKAML